MGNQWKKCPSKSKLVQVQVYPDWREIPDSVVAEKQAGSKLETGIMGDSVEYSVRVRGNRA